jgi:hypothetical protein
MTCEIVGIKTSRRWQCTIKQCNKTFVHQNTLTSHLRSDHQIPNDMVHPCIQSERGELINVLVATLPTGSVEEVASENGKNRTLSP